MQRVVAERVDHRDPEHELRDRHETPAGNEPVVVQDVARAGDAKDDGHGGAQDARGNAPARRHENVDAEPHLTAVAMLGACLEGCLVNSSSNQNPWTW